MSAISTFASTPEIDTSNSLPEGTSLQEFVIEREVGTGGFGIVYQAWDTLLQRSVAIKEYMPISMASRGEDATIKLRSGSFARDFESGKMAFIDEARLLARFKHPALIEVFRFWEQNGTAYMAMPFYKGQTLKERLRQEPGVPQEVRLKLILMPVLDALEHMHQEQVYHRDISPDNIMLMADDTPILLDLGAARRIEMSQAQSFTALVKPGYAPIEQYAGDVANHQGPWTDLYGWGATAYFALTGKPPPPAASRVMNDTIVRLTALKPAGYSHDFLAAIDATLAVRPDDRPQSVAELRMLLAIETPVELIPDAAEAMTAFATAPMDLTRTSAAAVAMAQAETATALADATQESPQVTAVENLSQTSAAPIEGRTSQLTRANGPRNLGFVLACILVVIGAMVGIIRSGPPHRLASDSAGTMVVPSIAPASGQDSEAAGATAPIPSSGSSAASAAEPVASEKPAIARLAVKPWGEVFVNGERRGVSPPLKVLSLPAGEYNIEIRNGDFSPYRKRIKVISGQSLVLDHLFVDPGPR